MTNQLVVYLYSVRQQPAFVLLFTVNTFVLYQAVNENYAELHDSDGSSSDTSQRRVPPSTSVRKLESFGCKTTPLSNRRGVKAKLDWPLTEEAIFYKNMVCSTVVCLL